VSAGDQAETIARALNGRRCGNGWICHCPVPAHTDRHPSLRISERDGKVLIRRRLTAVVQEQRIARK
jgi:hypothetical protein